MKLFQRLLVAPAALGLLAPISATATEVNLNDVSNYSEGDMGISTKSFKPLSTKNPLLAGGEGAAHDHSDDFDADSFSSTVVASFAADFAIGSVDGLPSNGQGASGQDKVAMVYGYEVELTTTFTGNDSLDVVLEGGNSTTQLTELDLSKGSTANRMTVGAISYNFPLGDKTNIFFGNNIEGTALYNTACVYGAATDTLSDCGTSSSNFDKEFGTAAGLNYTNGDFSVAIGYEGQGQGSEGLMSKEGTDAYGAQLAYTGNNYGVSASISRIETSQTDDDTFTGINAFYAPDNVNFPSISIGYEWGDDGSAADTADETSQYFVGVQWDDVIAGTFGAALGTKTPTVEGNDDRLMYEAYYAYPVSDGLTVTPIVYVKENSGSTDDETGMILKTSFRF